MGNLGVIVMYFFLGREQEWDTQEIQIRAQKV